VIWNSTYLITGGNDGVLYCIDTKYGYVRWTNAISTANVGIGGSPAVHVDLLNRTCVYICASGQLFQLNLLTGAKIASTVLNRVGIPNTVSTPTIANIPGIGTLLFVVWGAGSTTFGDRSATLAAINDTTLTSVGLNRTLSLASGNMTPIIQTASVVISQSCLFPNNTNLGTVNSAGTDNRGGPDVYRYNDTGTARYFTFPVVYVCEATDATAYALIANQTNLGTGTTQATRWIVNYTTDGMTFNFTRIWNSWVGHQVEASHAIAINSDNPNCPLSYLGNAAEGFVLYNGTSGKVVSTYSSNAPVFSSACLYKDKVYVGSNDGYVVAFIKSPETTTIFADSDKGNTMAVKETTLIQGELTTTKHFVSPLESDIIQTFSHVEIPYATVNLAWVNTDGTSQQLSTTTDRQGKFNFTFTPTLAGANKWLVFFDGSTSSSGVYLPQAYSSYVSMNVVGGPTPTPSNGETATPTNNGNGSIDMNYVYAIVGIIVALVVVIAIVMLLRRKK
jgi:hypothetical protein